MTAQTLAAARSASTRHGPDYRRGDEPRRETTRARVRHVFAYCAAVDRNRADLSALAVLCPVSAIVWREAVRRARVEFGL